MGEQEGLEMEHGWKGAETGTGIVGGRERREREREGVKLEAGKGAK